MSETYMQTEMDEMDDQEVSNGGDNSNVERFLTFKSDGLTYAIDTLYVTEIITNYGITVLPMVPHYITGIFNLRGAIVPILDIRARMGKTPTDISNGCCIIVLDVDSVHLGIIIDEVSQVVDIDQTKISSMPVNNHQELVNAMITINDGTTLLFMDCEQLTTN